MTGKTKYIQRIQELYLQKEGVVLTDAKALEYFESLIVLVENVYGKRK